MKCEGIVEIYSAHNFDLGGIHPDSMPAECIMLHALTGVLYVFI